MINKAGSYLEKKILMILNISPLKSAITSISSALLGTWIKENDPFLVFTLLADKIHPVFFHMSLETANTFFQHAAWTVAILAGLVSSVNGIIKTCDRVKSKIEARKERILAAKKNKPEKL